MTGILTTVKVSGSASCPSRNVAAGEGELPTSATITEHVYSTNVKAERCAEGAIGREPPQSEQTQQRHVRSLSDLAGLEFTCKTQQEPQQVINVITYYTTLYISSCFPNVLHKFSQFDDIRT